MESALVATQRWHGEVVAEVEGIARTFAIEVPRVLVDDLDLVALVSEAVLQCFDHGIRDAVRVGIEGVADDHLHAVLLERNAFAAEDAVDLANQRRTDRADLLDVLLRALAEREVEAFDVVGRNAGVHAEVQALRIRNDVPENPRGQFFRHHLHLLRFVDLPKTLR